MFKLSAVVWRDVKSPKHLSGLHTIVKLHIVEPHSSIECERGLYAYCIRYSSLKSGNAVSVKKTPSFLLNNSPTAVE